MIDIDAIFPSKVMMKKLPKINEIANMPKSAKFQNCKRYLSQILITQFKIWIKVVSTFRVRIYDIIGDISRQKVSWSGQAGSGGAGSTLEMDLEK